MATVSVPAQVGIFYHTDPIAHVPGGIDTFLRGILKFAPPDLQYTLFGATADPVARPVGRSYEVPSLQSSSRFRPLIDLRPVGLGARLPGTVRLLWAMARAHGRGLFEGLAVLDFQRIEPMLLFRNDPRPKNILLHQDMTILRDPNADIGWRYAPGVYEALERSLFAHAARIFCVRESAITRYKQTFPEWADRFEFMPTWVDTEIFSPAPDPSARRALRRQRREQLGVPGEAKLLVSVGRLDPQKDPLLLIEAMARATRAEPQLHLIMLGDGILRHEVQGAIERLSLGRHVTLAGVAPPGVIADWLRAADAFVMSSAFEGMPIAVLEALACGLPVVSTAVGEIPRVVEPGVCGALAERGSADALAAAIARGLALDGAAAIRASVAAAAPFGPQAVLGLLYRNHRRQTEASLPAGSATRMAIS